MSKEYQIFLAILLFLSIAGFVANMLTDTRPLWIRGYNLVVVILWGIFIFSRWKKNN